MPSFGIAMSDQQIATLANYVRTSWGNAAAPDATSSMIANLGIQQQIRTPPQ